MVRFPPKFDQTCKTEPGVQNCQMSILYGNEHYTSDLNYGALLRMIVEDPLMGYRTV